MWSSWDINHEYENDLPTVPISYGTPYRVPLRVRGKQPRSQAQSKSISSELTGVRIEFIYKFGSCTRWDFSGHGLCPKGIERWRWHLYRLNNRKFVLSATVSNKMREGQTFGQFYMSCLSWTITMFGALRLQRWDRRICTYPKTWRTAVAG